MKRSTFILLVDIISFVGFVFLTSTGILLHYILPPGSGRWSDIWGFNRHEWGNIHYDISVIFLCLLTTHLLIHWRVIINMIKGRKSETSLLRLGLGITGLIALLLFAFAPVASTTSTDTSPAGKGWRHQTEVNQ